MLVLSPLFKLNNKLDNSLDNKFKLKYIFNTWWKLILTFINLILIFLGFSRNIIKIKTKI